MAPLEHFLDRRRLLRAGFFSLFVGACGTGTSNRPTLQLAIGRSRDEIDGKSSLKVSDTPSLPFTHFITTPHIIIYDDTPHIIIYDDTRLKLTLPDCGAKMSMPTVLSFGDDLRLNICSASVLGDYVDVFSASNRARALLSEIAGQGFTFDEGRYARLATLDDFPAAGVTVPRNLDREDDIESFFLKPEYSVGQIIVFQLSSGDLGVDLRIKNMRRSFHSGPASQLRIQEDGLSDTQRREEKVYYLEIHFSSHEAMTHSNYVPGALDKEFKRILGR